MAEHPVHHDPIAGRAFGADPLTRTSKLRQTAGGYWQIVYSEPNGSAKGWRSRTFSCGTKDFTEAQRVLVDWLSERQAKLAEAKKARTVKVTMHDLFEFYVREKTGDIHPIRLVTVRQLQRLLGGLLPSEITPDVLRNYCASRVQRYTGKPVTSGTLLTELSMLRAVIRYGYNAELIDTLTWPRNFRMPKKNSPRDRFLEHEDEQRFWEEAQKVGGELGLFVALGLDTAARKEAILNLTWDRVNFSQRLVDYKSEPRVRDTKNKNRAIVPICDRLLPVLEKAREASGGRQRLFSTKLRAAFELFAERIGYGWVTPHTMRHTWASLAAIDGVPMAHIAEGLADTIDMVHKTYAHLQPGHLRGAFNRPRPSVSVKGLAA